MQILLILVINELTRCFKLSRKAPQRWRGGTRRIGCCATIFTTYFGAWFCLIFILLRKMLLNTDFTDLHPPTTLGTGGFYILLCKMLDC